MVQDYDVQLHQTLHLVSSSHCTGLPLLPSDEPPTLAAGPTAQQTPQNLVLML